MKDTVVSARAEDETAGKARPACRSKRWSELSGRERAAIIVLGSAEVALTAYAAADLFHRPQSETRGHKALWWPILAVQPLGPITYLVLGRRPRHASATAE